jgi:hypothetical protein
MVGSRAVRSPFQNKASVWNYRDPGHDLPIGSVESRAAARAFAEARRPAMVRIFSDGKLECEHECDDWDDDINVYISRVGGPER